MYVCDRIDANFQFDHTEMKLIGNCSSNNPEVKEALLNVYFKLSKKSILDGSFDLLNNELFLTIYQNKPFDDIRGNFGSYMHDRLTFRYVKGFEIGNFKTRRSSVRMDFYYSNFDFYLNGSLIRSCGDQETFLQYEYAFYSFLPLCFPCYSHFKFINCEYGIQNTFYKSNFPRFQPISNPSLNENTYKIFFVSLELVNMQNIELNSVILNDYLFSNLRSIRLFGDIVSIEKGLFKSFKEYRKILKKFY